MNEMYWVSNYILQTCNKVLKFQQTVQRMKRLFRNNCVTAIEKYCKIVHVTLVVQQFYEDEICDLEEKNCIVFFAHKNSHSSGI